MQRGNVWLPRMKAATLLDKADQIRYQEIPWHEQQGAFVTNTPSSYSLIEMIADGVFNTHSFEISGPLWKNMDFQLNIKSNQVDGGKVPYSLLTSDQALEWFHSNIAGGEDPFGRKKFPFDQVNFEFIDVNGKTLHLRKNSVYLTESSLATFYYFKIDQIKMKSNIGIHLGTTFYNGLLAIEPGLSFTGNRVFIAKKRDRFQAGMAFNFIYTGLRNENKVEISKKKNLTMLEVQMNWVRNLKNNTTISAGINYHIQSPLLHYSDSKNTVFMGDRISSHWHYGLTSLYRPVQGWSFSFIYQRKSVAYSTFFREDFVVDNAPDFQVGWAISFLLKN